MPTPIDVDRFAGHVRGLRNQEVDGLGDVIRRPLALQQRVRNDALARHFVECRVVGRFGLRRLCADVKNPSLRARGGGALGARQGEPGAT